MKKRPFYLDKYDAFQRDLGINIIEQSDKNINALKKRLTERTLVPDNEKSQYGKNMLSESEEQFFSFWIKTIVPLFTAKHGTTQLKKIKKAGSLMPVADRRREFDSHKNSRTGGRARQEFNYFVLGIGDDHPVPVSCDTDIIQLNIAKIRDSHAHILQGAFIGCHLQDYIKSRKYPIKEFGNTAVIVDYYKNNTKKITFKRSDKTTIIEMLNFKDEIVAAIPDFDKIFEFLGLKLIEYLRFIGDDFQKEILTCEDITKIKATFHTLFPSYRFPELKIPARIPIPKENSTISFVECKEKDPNISINSYKLHNAIMGGKLKPIQDIIESTNIDINILNYELQSPFAAVMSALCVSYDGTISHRMYISLDEDKDLSYKIINLLLENGADINSSKILDTALGKSITLKDYKLCERLVQGSANPHYPSIRELPLIDLNVMKAVLKRSEEELFLGIYPHYRDDPHELLHLIYNYINDNKNTSPFFILAFNTILQDCNPNYHWRTGTPLHHAAYRGNNQFLELLLKHPDIDVNRTINTQKGKIDSHEGATALHLAVERGHIECAQKLLAAGAKVNSVDARGCTPLQLTSQKLPDNDFSQIIKLLEQHGATENHSPPVETPKNRSYAAAAIVTATFKDKRFILLIRKSNQFGDPVGRYMFPGGIKNSTDIDFKEAAARETLEETGVDISSAKTTKTYSHSNTANKTYFKRKFYHFELGKCKLPPAYPSSDVACAEWIDITDLLPVKSPMHSSFKINNIPLRCDNSILLQHILLDQPINSEEISKLLRVDLITENIRKSFKEILEMYLKDNIQKEKLNLFKTDCENLVKCGVIETNVFSTFLAQACTHGVQPLIDWLVSVGADINQSSLTFAGVITPLIILIMKQKYKIAKDIVKNHHADVDFFCNGVSALSAVFYNTNPNFEFFQFLLSHLEEPTNELIGSALITAISSKKTEFIKELLSQFKINLNTPYPQLGALFSLNQHFPLAIACGSGLLEVVQLLLENNANPMLQPYSHTQNIFTYTIYKQQDIKDAFIRAEYYGGPAKMPEKQREIYNLSETDTLEDLQIKINDFDKILELLISHMQEKEHSNKKVDSLEC